MAPISRRAHDSRHAAVGFLAACGLAGCAAIQSAEMPARTPLVLTGGAGLAVVPPAGAGRLSEGFARLFGRSKPADAAQPIDVDPFRSDLNPTAAATTPAHPAIAATAPQPATVRPPVRGQVFVPARPAAPRQPAAGTAFVREPNPFAEPANPFAATSAVARPTAERDPFAADETVQPAGYGSCPVPGCATPAGRVALAGSPWSDDADFSDDRRLPPGQPLGGADPFGAATAAPVAAEPQRNRVVSPRPVGWRRAGEPSAAPIGTRVSLRTDARPPGREPAGDGLRHPGMIVDADSLPARDELRIEPPARPSEPRPEILPRRPFAPPGWEPIDDDMPAVASANVPVELSTLDVEPDSRIAAYRPSETFSERRPAFSTASEVKERADVDAAPAPLLIAPPERSTDGPFIDAPAVEADDRELADAGPLLAPGPAFGAIEPPASEPAASEPAEPPVQVASATPASPRTRLSEYSDGAVPQPIELDAADRTDSAAQAAGPDRGPISPVMIGLGLAAVALGAVTIRRRFA